MLPDPARNTLYPPTPGHHHLFRGVLSPSKTLSLPLSAASRQASRLSFSPHSDIFIFSTSSNVYTLQGTPTRKRPRETPDRSTPTPAPSTPATHPSTSVSTAVTAAIADDYIVPRPFSTLSIQPYVPHCAHQSEVQSISTADTRIATVDSYGRAIITIQKTPPDSGHESDSFVLPPVSISHGEPGWAGVALKPHHPAVAIVARQFFRDITIFDRDVAVRTLNSICPMNAMQVCGDLGVVAVSEGPGVSFYDFRCGERGACIARKNAGNGMLLALDVSEDGGLVGTAGMERIVHVFDTKMMTVRDRWSGCLKYEVAGMVMSREMEGMAYVCSVDNEVACGAWSGQMAAYLKQTGFAGESPMMSGANTKSPRRAFGFRGDVRLTGIARRNVEGEEIAVMSEAGAFYLLRRKRE